MPTARKRSPSPNMLLIEAEVVVVVEAETILEVLSEETEEEEDEEEEDSVEEDEEERAEAGMNVAADKPIAFFPVNLIKAMEKAASLPSNSVKKTVSPYTHASTKTAQ